MTNAASLGITNTQQPCYITAPVLSLAVNGVPNAQPIGYPNGTLCSDPDAHLSWDQYAPSFRTHLGGVKWRESNMHLSRVHACICVHLGKVSALLQCEQQPSSPISTNSCKHASVWVVHAHAWRWLWQVPSHQGCAPGTRAGSCSTARPLGDRFCLSLPMPPAVLTHGRIQ